MAARHIDRLFRSLDVPFLAGQTIDTTEFAADVLEVTEDGRPACMRFRFHLPMQDPRLRWLAFSGRDLVEWKPPPVGGRVRMPANLWTLLSAFQR